MAKSKVSASTLENPASSREGALGEKPSFFDQAPAGSITEKEQLVAKLKKRIAEIDEALQKLDPGGPSPDADVAPASTP